MSTLSQRPILVVDDDPVSCELIAEILAEEGYATEFAHSPAEVLKRIPESRYRLIVSDVCMPGMSGPALASQVRQTQPDVPILFVTAFPDLTTERDARELNVPILRKPFAAGILLERVRGLLGDTSPAAADTRQT